MPSGLAQFAGQCLGRHRPIGLGHSPVKELPAGWVKTASEVRRFHPGPAQIAIAGSGIVAALALAVGQPLALYAPAGRADDRAVHSVFAKWNPLRNALAQRLGTPTRLHKSLPLVAAGHRCPFTVLLNQG